ncbi:hypothetical protein ACEPAI_3607 [Sanghuangporus weigelae]
MLSFVIKAFSEKILSSRERRYRAHTALAEVVAFCLLNELIDGLVDVHFNERDNSPTRMAYTQKTLQPALRSAALVCRTWYKAVRKHLYNEIYISSPKSLDLLYRTLSEVKELRPLVQRFYFTGTIFATGNILHMRTRKDLCLRERQIIGLCPNLALACVGEPKETEFPRLDVEAHDDALRGLQFDRLTHFEVHALCTFPSGILPKQFPVLQSLKIKYHSDLYRYGFVRSALPRLRRLELINVSLFPRARLVLPRYAPMVNSIELELFDVEESLFDPNESALLLYRETLESLTIINNGKGLGTDGLLDYREQTLREAIKITTTKKCSLEFLQNLVQLCIPFCTFAEMSQMTFPPRLRHLFLFGDTSRQYGVFYQDLFYGLIELYRIASMKKEGKAFKELERIEAVIGGVEESRSLGRFLTKVDFGLVLKFGFESPEYKHGPPVFIDDSEIGPLAHPGSFMYLLELLRLKAFLLFRGKGQF